MSVMVSGRYVSTDAYLIGEHIILYVAGASPRCEDMREALDSGSEGLSLPAADGLCVPEPSLVLPGPQFPPLYIWAWPPGALLAILAWLRSSGSWALQASPELRPSLPGSCSQCWLPKLDSSRAINIPGASKGSQLSASGQHLRPGAWRPRHTSDPELQSGVWESGELPSGRRGWHRQRGAPGLQRGSRRGLGTSLVEELRDCSFWFCLQSLGPRSPKSFRP